MTSFELLAQLRRLNVTLRADGDQLRYDAPDGALTPDILAQLAVFTSNTRALRRYVARAYPKRVGLFRAATQPAEAGADPTRGWGAISAGVAQEVVPGDHYSIIRPPHVQTLAERLNVYLEAARGM